MMLRSVYEKQNNKPHVHQVAEVSRRAQHAAQTHISGWEGMATACKINIYENNTQTNIKLTFKNLIEYSNINIWDLR